MKNLIKGILIGLVLATAVTIFSQVKFSTINVGTSLPGTCEIGQTYFKTDTVILYVCSPANTWASTQGSGSGGVPTGLIVLTLSSCGTGFTEVLSGQFLLGTTTGNGDVGTTGGSNNITPTGTNATGTVTPLGTINTPTISWPAGVPTNGTGTVTATGTIAWPAGVPTYTGTVNTLAVTAHTVVSTKQGASAGNVVTTATHAITGIPGGTVAWPAGVPTFSGTSATTSAEVISWPAGVPTSSALTLTGSSSVTSAQTFTGNSFDNRPVFTKVIFCQKN